MSVLFSPDGNLNVAIDPSDLPEEGDKFNSVSGAMVRCKNLRINQRGQAKTRDGSAKLNASAIETAIWWIEEQGGDRYTFAGTKIYKNESSIATGLTSAQWSAIKYSSFNDSTYNIFALNGTNRKRIQSDTAYEWGIAAPTDAPTVSNGQGAGLTGIYNAKYTYVRKADDVVLCESNPSPAATNYVTLSNQSLLVDVTTPSDTQVTHIRLYRTEASGAIYYLDQEIPVAGFSYGVSFEWESTDVYLSGTAYIFTITDDTHGTENCYTWEEDLSVQTDHHGTYGGNEWYGTSEEYYNAYIAYLLSIGQSPISYEEWLLIGWYSY